MNDTKVTKIVLRFNHYNGDYGIGSVFDEYYLLDVKEALNNGWGWANFKIITTFCANSFNANNELADFSIGIPTPVRPDGIKKFNELVEKIKNNPEYLAEQEEDSFKRLEFVNIEIDKNKYKINIEDNIINELITTVIDYQKIKKATEEYRNAICEPLRALEYASNSPDGDSNTLMDIPSELRTLNNDALLFEKIYKEIKEFTQ